MLCTAQYILLQLATSTMYWQSGNSDKITWMDYVKYSLDLCCQFYFVCLACIITNIYIRVKNKEVYDPATITCKSQIPINIANAFEQLLL